jgi:hypothetical protein
LIAGLIGGCSTGNLGAGEAGADRTEKDLARLATGLTLSTINPSTPWNCWKKTASGRLLGRKQQTKSQAQKLKRKKGRGVSSGTSRKETEGIPSSKSFHKLNGGSMEEI